MSADPTGPLEAAIRRFEDQRAVARRIAISWRATTLAMGLVPVALWWGAPDALTTPRGVVGLLGMAGALCMIARVLRTARDEALGEQHERLSLEARSIERAMRKLPLAGREAGE